MSPRRAWRDYADLVALLLGGIALLLAAVWFGLKRETLAELDDDIRFAFFTTKLESGLMSDLLGWMTSGPVLLVTAAAVVLSLLQRQWRLAVAIPLITLAAIVLAAALRESILHRSPGIPKGEMTLPSANTTVALVLAVAVICAVPRMLRPLASLAGGFLVGGVAIGSLAKQWHRPSDIVAAVAVLLIAAACSFFLTSRQTAPRVRAAGFDRAVGHPALATLGAGLAAWRWVALDMQPISGSRSHTLFYGSIVVLAVVIGIGLGMCAVVADRHFPPAARLFPLRTKVTS
ncbi:MAG: hypothetical protein V9G19_22345 [Tetrasphaera sp.]